MISPDRTCFSLPPAVSSIAEVRVTTARFTGPALTRHLAIFYDLRQLRSTVKCSVTTCYFCAPVRGSV